LENVETQSKLLSSVQSSLSSMDENISKSFNKTDDLEIKLKSWTENAESNLSMYATLSALQVYLRLSTRRDNCEEFTPSFFVISWFPENVNLFPDLF